MLIKICLIIVSLFRDNWSMSLFNLEITFKGLPKDTTERYKV